MIQIKSVSKIINKQNILDNITLEIPEGDFWGIIGESGAGKSTLLKCINRLIGIDKGSIFIDGSEIGKLDGKALRKLRKNMGMIFQSFALMSQKNVADNIALPLECWNYTKVEIDNRVKYLADLVGISEHLYKRPKNLSGGQKQRVAIARAIATNPKYLLCDECTSALDPKNSKVIMNLLKQIQNDLGVTVIIVTHDMQLAKTYCNQLTLLEKGKLIETNMTQKIIEHHPEIFTNFNGGDLIV